MNNRLMHERTLEEKGIERWPPHKKQTAKNKTKLNKKQQKQNKNPN